MMTKNFRNRLRSVQRKAALDKKIFPHLFRYSGTTEDLKNRSERTVKRTGGWSPNSRLMSDIYDIISDEDAEEEKLALHGFIKKKDTSLIIDKCSRCGNLNSNLEERCIVCGNVLQLNLDDPELEDEIIITRVIERDDFQELFIKFIREEREKLQKETKQ